jgi:gamma-glutamyl-gamma-aminobutyrate hydrolase PuuD
MKRASTLCPSVLQRSVLRPSVLVVTRRTVRKHRYIDYVGEAHLALLMRLGILPVIVPVVEGTPACLPDYMANMRGLLVVEGEDVEPEHYDAVPANFEYLEKTHPLKDKIEIRLLRHALRQQLPVLGICRGSQLLNVVCGGTLYGDVQKEKKSPLQHIDLSHYDTYRHGVSVVKGSPLEKWYQRERLSVNSYHHQGVRQLARRFQPMAHSEDGLIEAYFDPRAEFVVGLQFHPERMAEETAGNLRIWKAFSSAVRRAAKY